MVQLLDCLNERLLSDSSSVTRNHREGEKQRHPLFRLERLKDNERVPAFEGSLERVRLNREMHL